MSERPRKRHLKWLAASIPVLSLPVLVYLTLLLFSDATQADGGNGFNRAPHLVLQLIAYVLVGVSILLILLAKVKIGALLGGAVFMLNILQSFYWMLFIGISEQTILLVTFSVVGLVILVDGYRVCTVNQKPHNNDGLDLEE